ncbi:NAD(P)/FAD-dependent oxidoreductase [Rhodovibrionaceae bacterium A322]
MIERVQTVVVGAGVVGLAVARALAMSGREVIILESEEAIGTITSSRNSEIIHAGIYYPTGSLKALACVAGKQKLYDFCDSHGVPYKRCGKLIVATSKEQLETLEGIKQKAAANRVEDLRWMTQAEIADAEPAITVEGALHSPSTGLVDTHSLMLAYQGDAEDHGAMLALHAPVLRGVVENDGIRLEVGGEYPMTLKAEELVNAAGLNAAKLTGSLENFPDAHLPTYYFAKGNYFTLQGKSPFNGPIYPVPEAAGLGVHVTVDMGGQARFGPDVEWVENPEDYDVDPRRADSFYEAVRRYWPDLQDGAILPGYSGMRPKLQSPTGGAVDFRIDGPALHGVPGLVNMFGIESPGLTASLDLADRVLESLENS